MRERCQRCGYVPAWEATEPTRDIGWLHRLYRRAFTVWCVAGCVGWAVWAWMSVVAGDWLAAPLELVVAAGIAAMLMGERP